MKKETAKTVAPAAGTLSWEWFTLLVGAVEADGQKLVIAMRPVVRNWYTVMVEAPAGVGIETIFENHAHAHGGPYRTFETAEKAAEAYAKRWVRRKVKEAKCRCVPIGRRRRRSG